jgi:Ankyrin repeat.
MKSEIDTQFRDAVAAVDAGDVDSLARLVAANPALVSTRLETPGAWLRDVVGNALDGFFKRPYLLWFVAEDPVRNGRLPSNIAAVTQAIVDAARREDVPSLQEQLDYALTLVSWSWIARECGVQIALIDVLVDAGAQLAGNANNALVNGNHGAAAHLVARGAPLTLASALVLGRHDAVDELLAHSNAGQQRFAFVLSALNGKAGALRRLIEAGVDVNTPSENLYSHGTPLHHAVASGSIEAVRVLLAAGADVHRADTAWNGTPVGWALHYANEAKDDATRQRYEQIADVLRTAC